MFTTFSIASFIILTLSDHLQSSGTADLIAGVVLFIVLLAIFSLGLFRLIESFPENNQAYNNILKNQSEILWIHPLPVYTSFLQAITNKYFFTTIVFHTYKEKILINVPSKAYFQAMLELKILFKTTIFGNDPENELLFNQKKYSYKLGNND